jgi:hypothetical protein
MLLIRRRSANFPLSFPQLLNKDPARRPRQRAHQLSGDEGPQVFQEHQLPQAGGAARGTPLPARGGKLAILTRCTPGSGCSIRRGPPPKARSLLCRVSSLKVLHR